jgi:hypothetical protein
MQRRSNGKINFNFTNEQQERFSLLYEETKKVHPQLCDEVMSEKTKVILAHFIINEHKYSEKDWNEFTEALAEVDEI